MISGVLRTFAIGWSALLIALIGAGTLSPAKIGTLTWGPTVDFWAISIAISNIEFKLKGTLGYREVLQELVNHLTTAKSDVDIADEGTQRLLRQPDTITHGIRAASQVKRQDLKPERIQRADVVTTGAEDAGYPAFYNLAFRVFGYNSRSTHYLYMTFIALSFGLFVLAYWRENRPLGILTLGITALFLSTSAEIFSVAVPSMAANRFLSTLALIPLLHLLIATLDSKPLRAADGLALMLQCLTIAFAIWTRSSAQWTAVAVVVLAIILGILRSPAPRTKGFVRSIVGSGRSIFAGLKFGERLTAVRSLGPGTLSDAVKRFFRLSRLVVVPTLLLVILVSANLVQKFRLDRIYFGDDILPHHLVWHSAYMALDLHPKWPERIPYKQLAGLSGDALPGNLSKILCDERGITFTSSSGGMRWRIHEQVIRSAYLDFLVKNPGYSLELFLFYKPKKLLEHLGTIVPTVPAPAWLLATIALGMSTTLIAIGNEGRMGEILLAIGTMFLFSLAPSIWAYAAPHVMADQLWSSLFLGMALIACGVAMAIRRFRSLPGMLTK